MSGYPWSSWYSFNHFHIAKIIFSSKKNIKMNYPLCGLKKLNYNFTNIFDDPVQDAQFIWSTNLILDNEVVVTYTVPAPTSLNHISPSKNKCHAYPNPANNSIYIKFESAIAQQEVTQIILENVIGELVFKATHFVDQISLDSLPNGIYTLKIISRENQITEKFIKQ
jgi:hypothetical protein